MNKAGCVRDMTYLNESLVLLLMWKVVTECENKGIFCFFKITTI
jgi:hypothetical protein